MLNKAVVMWLELWKGHGCAVVLLWAIIPTAAVLLPPSIRLQRWRECHVMSFMLISEPPCLSLQPSEECGALGSMAAHCCSPLKHACSRNVTAQSSFFSIKIHKESCQNLKNDENVPHGPFQSISSALLFRFCFPHWGMGGMWKWKKSLSHMFWCWWWSGPVCLLSLRALWSASRGGAPLPALPLTLFPCGLGLRGVLWTDWRKQGQGRVCVYESKISRHTVGLSSCFHCPSLLPRERREEEREMLLTVHCHKHKRVLNGRTEWRHSSTIFSFLITYYYFHRCLCAAEFNQKRSNMKIRGKNTNFRDRCYKMKRYTLRCITVLL